MVDGDPLDAAREVGLPVLALGRRLLLVGEVVPPSELLQHLVVELRIAVREVRAHAVHTLGEQVHAIALDAEPRPEGEAAVADRHARVVEHRGARVPLLGDRLTPGVDVGELGVRVPPRRPRHSVVVAVGGSALGQEARGVEGLAVLRVELEPLGALAGVADRPHPLVDLAGDVLDVRLVGLRVDADVGEQLVREAELARELGRDGVVGQRLPHRVDDLVAPLDGAVRRGDRAVGLELGRRGKEVRPFRAIVHDRGMGRIRVDDDHEVKLLHGRLHLVPAGLAVDRVSPEHHRPHVVALADVLPVLVHAVDPARDRDALVVHGQDFLAAVADDRGGVEAGLEPVEVRVPHARPVRPGAGAEAVVAREGVGEDAEIRRALDVVVTAEDVRAAAGLADVAERELQHAVRAGVVVADGVLRPAHAPHDGAGPVLGHQLRRRLHRLGRSSGDPLGLLRCPFRHLGADLVHSVDALADVLLVLPAVLEDVPQHAPHQAHVGAGAKLHVQVSVRGGAREARVAHDHLRAVLLRAKDVLHRDGVSLGRVRPDEDHRLRLVHVVVGVGHGAVAPRVGNSRDRRRVADAGLVVDVVRPPVRRELAEEVGLLVAVLGRAEPVHRVGPRLLADAQHGVADLVDGVVPAHALPLAAGELHRVLHTAGADAVLAHRSALRAVRAQVQRGLEVRLLPRPHAVLQLGDDAAADRAVRADAAPHLGRDALLRAGRRVGLAHHGGRQHRRDGRASHGQAGAPEEGPPSDRIAWRRDMDGTLGPTVLSDELHHGSSSGSCGQNRASR